MSQSSRTIIRTWVSMILFFWNGKTAFALLDRDEELVILDYLAGGTV